MSFIFLYQERSNDVIFESAGGGILILKNQKKGFYMFHRKWGGGVGGLPLLHNLLFKVSFFKSSPLPAPPPPQCYVRACVPYIIYHSLPQYFVIVTLSISLIFIHSRHWKTVDIDTVYMESPWSSHWLVSYFYSEKLNFQVSYEQSSIFYPFGSSRGTLHNCSTLSFAGTFIRSFAMQNLRILFICWPNNHLK